MFAQDQWRVTPNLTVNYGLRYERTSLPQPKVTNPDYPQTAKIPVSTKEFMPRVGLAYSFDNQKMVARVGYGIFFSRYQNGLISNLFQNNAVLQPSVSLSGANPAQLAAGPVFPNVLASSPFARNGTTVQFAAPNMRAPYSQQATVAVERQFGARHRGDGILHLEPRHPTSGRARPECRAAGGAGDLQHCQRRRPDCRQLYHSHLSAGQPRGHPL